MNENNDYHDVADGVYDCVITGARRQEKHFGKDATQHIIMSIGVRVSEDEEAAVYYAEIPLVLTVGKQWDFYDKTSNKSVTRNVTAKDVCDAWEHVRKMFPAWANFVDEMQEGVEDPYIEAANWFCNAGVGTHCKAKLRNRKYPGTDERGSIVDKVAHDATVYEAISQSIVDKFDYDFCKSLKAAGIKIGIKAKSTVENKSSFKPLPPSHEATKSVTDNKIYTSEDSWSAYENNMLRTDPDASKYWSRVGELVGKDPADYEKFTSDDWKKCVDVFSKK